MKKIIPAPKG